MELYEDCDGDEDCLKEGNRFSHVFLTNGLLMLFMVFNMCCVAVGAYKLKVRLCAGFCGMCLCVAHFAILVATAVYRFRIAGRLTAMNP